jgi:threonine dehydrogenase-like Zn-dependent dehydrogenase
VKSLLFYGPGDVRLEDVLRPEPGPGDVLVQVEVALMDGLDAPPPVAELPSPFGNEFCGVPVGSGERVVAANSLLNGAFAEYVLVPAHIAERNLLPVPPGLASEVAALVEPLAGCLHEVERVGIEAGQTVAVAGLGPIGFMLCAAAKDAGANVVAVDGRPERRELATDFGAAPGNGRDVVIEELTLRGSLQHTPRTVRAALAFLASGAHPWERLVTHQTGLEEVPALLEDPPPDLIKAAVIP